MYSTEQRRRIQSVSHKTMSMLMSVQHAEDEHNGNAQMQLGIGPIMGLINTCNAQAACLGTHSLQYTNNVDGCMMLAVGRRTE